MPHFLVEQINESGFGEEDSYRLPLAILPTQEGAIAWVEENTFPDNPKANSSSRDEESDCDDEEELMEGEGIIIRISEWEGPKSTTLFNRKENSIWPPQSKKVKAQKKLVKSKR